jgi:hypothetical protein
MFEWPVVRISINVMRLAVCSVFKLIDLAQLLELDRHLSGEGLHQSGTSPVDRYRIRRSLETVERATGKNAQPYSPGGRREWGMVRWFWTDGADLFLQNAGRLNIPEGMLCARTIEVQHRRRIGSRQSDAQLAPRTLNREPIHPLRPAA